MTPLIHSQIIKGSSKDLYFSEPEIFVDNESKGRSGHVGHALAMLENGRIIDFYANVSGVLNCGHSAYGWMEYRISDNYGKSFGEPRVFPYSWEKFLEGIETVSIEKTVACGNNTVVAFCLMNDLSNRLICEPFGIPKVVISNDKGETWGQPQQLCEYKGRVYDALAINNDIYVLLFCNDASDKFTGTLPSHVYRLYKSTDEGKTFIEVCVVPFPDCIGRSYGNMVLRKDGSLVVYAYNINDQMNMDYIITKDLGVTWYEYGQSFVAKKIRNPQVALIGDQYILHGRGGENEAGSGSFVIYTSPDAIHWDLGKILVDGRPACFYSNNLVVDCPDGKQRMLMQYSENFRDPTPGVWSGGVNVMHAWIEEV